MQATKKAAGRRPQHKFSRRYDLDMYSFRVPVSLRGGRPDTDDDTLTLLSSGEERIWIQATGPLKTATRATFRGSGYATHDAAAARGTELCSTLRLAALRTGLSIDFMERQSFSVLSDYGLATTNDATPANVRVINERAGVHVHLSEEELVTLTFTAEGHALNRPDHLMSGFADAMDEAVPSTCVHLAFDLFSQAIHAQGADSLLLTLVSAVEALVTPAKVEASERRLIALLAQQVAESDVVEDPARRAALANRVRALQNETVRAGAMRLVRRLEPREYGGLTPTKFFDRVYELRSRLSHGDGPSWRDVGDVGSELKRFTRDLIDLEFTSPTSAGG